MTLTSEAKRSVRTAAPAKTPRLTQEARSHLSRSKIIKAVHRLAMKKEVTEISVADICKLASMTTGAIYFHFGSKDGAIDEAIIDLVLSKYSRLDPSVELPLRELIGEIIDAVTEMHAKGGKQARAISAVINTRPRVYEAWLEGRRSVIARLEAAIRLHRGAQGLSLESSDYLAHFVLNSIEDIAMDVFQWRNPNLEPFARSLDDWKERQCALWSWAVSAPDV
jgi:AcrR family transcriptional regulator